MIKGKYMYINECDKRPDLFHVLVVCTQYQYKQFKAGKYLYNPDKDEFKLIKKISPEERKKYISYEEFYDPDIYKPESGWGSYVYLGDISEEENVNKNFISPSGDKMKVFGFCYSIC